MYVMFIIILCISDAPSPPNDFSLEVDRYNDQTITLTWSESVQTGQADEVEDYVLEKSMNGEEFRLVRLHNLARIMSGLLYNIHYHITVTAIIIQVAIELY